MKNESPKTNVPWKPKGKEVQFDALRLEELQDEDSKIWSDCE